MEVSLRGLGDYITHTPNGTAIPCAGTDQSHAIWRGPDAGDRNDLSGWKCESVQQGTGCGATFGAGFLCGLEYWIQSPVGTLLSLPSAVANFSMAPAVSIGTLAPVILLLLLFMGGKSK